MHSAVKIYIQLQVTLYSVPCIAGRFFVAPGRGFVLMKIRVVPPHFLHKIRVGLSRISSQVRPRMEYSHCGRTLVQ